ncbi:MULTISPECIES: DNA alkylation repair protein [unclassified Paenibacillus]|uniref:DNA alkylation repair protein n=1 Tax=unclassified Paenibacillus TaxID=185978 RepID=UPI001AE7FD88|nr:MULTISPECIES: DNA alkylation repair protein [unclassified Paenibacillus]MBP1156873.1 3-methyladenine DNA glycosylase AlkD [Paenibacillus sp. PvP091]MBP1172388.1 3-methyladenine DNA glycosylase AlkD [Paenibacillus sp. PvR098]MBP2438769.1 3-methyladenine DNA glycosylase AlkD [Paenibacillus sp. PvP052]
MVTINEIMSKLEDMGSEQTKQTFIRHGAKEPFFGVKIGDLKKLVKDVRKDQSFARALYDTGNSDAMYLAGLTVNPKTATKEMLQDWVRAANWYMLAEYTVAWVTAESLFALELAREWMKSSDELIATCGWSTYANYISITPDERLDIEEIKQLLQQVESTIHDERNRVRYNMNAFVIVVGTYVAALHEDAMRIAEQIGKVHVDVGATACKVPLASEYLRKVEAAGKVGKKRKTCIC